MNYGVCKKNSIDWEGCATAQAHLGNTYLVEYIISLREALLSNPFRDRTQVIQHTTLAKQIETGARPAGVQARVPWSMHAPVLWHAWLHVSIFFWPG